MAKNLSDKLVSLGTIAVGLVFVETAPATALDTYLGLTVALGGLITLVGAHTVSTVMAFVEKDFLGRSSGSTTTSPGSAAKSL